MTIIDEVRSKLNEREVNPISDNKFSIEYLNRSRCYLSVLKHQKKEVPDAALLELYMNLLSISKSWKDISSNSQIPIYSRSIDNHIFFSELASLVWKELSRRFH